MVCLTQDGIVELYVRGLEEQEMLKNFIPPKRAGTAHYLCSETRMHINSKREIGGGDVEVRRAQMGRELHIY